MNSLLCELCNSKMIQKDLSIVEIEQKLPNLIGKRGIRMLGKNTYIKSIYSAYAYYTCENCKKFNKFVRISELPKEELDKFVNTRKELFKQAKEGF